MGGTGSKLDKQLLEVLSTLTFLSKAEIVHCYQKFRELHPEAIDADPANEQVPIDAVIQHFEELQANPFADSICQTFSHNEDEMTFVDFIDMASCLSEKAPVNFKAEWLFKIFDFNRDGRLDRSDLTDIVFRLTGEERDGRPNMDVHQLSMVVQKVLDEVDTKKLGYIQPADFINLMGKSSNFAQNFCIRF